MSPRALGGPGESPATCLGVAKVLQVRTGRGIDASLGGGAPRMKKIMKIAGESKFLSFLKIGSLSIPDVPPAPCAGGHQESIGKQI